MNEQQPISHVVAGVIIAAVLIVISLVVQFTGIEASGTVAICSYLVIIAGLMLFINLYGKAKNYQVGYGNLFAYGFKTTAILTLVTILFTVIMILLFPDIKEKAFESAREELEKSRDLTPSEVDAQLNMGRRLFWPMTIGLVLLVYAIVGAIGSAIGAAITKKNKFNPVDQLKL